MSLDAYLFVVNSMIMTQPGAELKNEMNAISPEASSAFCETFDIESQFRHFENLDFLGNNFIANFMPTSILSKVANEILIQPDITTSTISGAYHIFTDEQKQTEIMKNMNKISPNSSYIPMDPSQSFTYFEAKRNWTTVVEMLGPIATDLTLGGYDPTKVMSFMVETPGACTGDAVPNTLVFEYLNILDVLAPNKTEVGISRNRNFLVTQYQNQLWHDNGLADFYQGQLFLGGDFSAGGLSFSNSALVIDTANQYLAGRGNLSLDLPFTSLYPSLPFGDANLLIGDGRLKIGGGIEIGELANVIGNITPFTLPIDQAKAELFVDVPYDTFLTGTVNYQFRITNFSFGWDDLQSGLGDARDSSGNSLTSLVSDILSVTESSVVADAIALFTPFGTDVTASVNINEVDIDLDVLMATNLITSVNADVDLDIEVCANAYVYIGIPFVGRVKKTLGQACESVGLDTSLDLEPF